jgi:hypothetical protein
MIRFVGSHQALLVLPIWATAAILYVVTIGVLYILRDRFEGLPYNVAYSSQVGDMFLICVVLIACTILQRGGEYPPAWMLSTDYHSLAAVVGVSIGITWWRIERPPHWGDIYHHLVVAPLFAYLAITLLPVIFKNGTREEVFATLGFALLWARLVVFDAKYKRLNQREWLLRHGFL